MEKKYLTNYKNFVDSWGEEAQIRMCIEEMSELTKELCKYLRFKDNTKTIEDQEKLKKVISNIIEETADVLNMAEQMQFIFGEDQVNSQRDIKINRCAQRLTKWKQENN